ncbi:MAG: hypothetical protein KDE27_29640, partial [Planctomycetes bacterium]|nr:hypothetical protein [Planctomycetota bacterium]
MVYRLIATFVVLVSIVGVAGLHASGTTVIPKTLPELAREAQLIVIATVTDSRAEWLDDTGLIYTHCDLAVEATLKGKAPRDLRVSEPGGTVGTMTLAVPSMPRYATGSRVLIFL